VALGLLGRHEDEAALARQMIVFAESVLPPNHRWTGILYGRLGEALFSLKRYPEALEAVDRDIAIATTSKDDRERGTTLGVRGDVLTGAGRPRDAIGAYDEALKVLAQGVPDDHDFVADALRGRGIAYLRAGDTDKAIADLEKAVSLYTANPQTIGGVRLSFAQARFALAQALWTTGSRAARIGELLTDARAAFVEVRADDDVKELDAWALPRAAALSAGAR